MKILWLILVVLGAFLAHRAWNESARPVDSSPAQRAEAGSGGVVRQWEQAPGALMEMQDATGGGGGNPSKAMRDTVRGGLNKDR